MSLKDKRIKSEYRSLIDNVVQDFYIPLLHESTSYKRAVGFFSSSALVEISKGIADMAKDGGKIEIVASPYLSDDDIQAIKEGYENRQKIIEGALIRQLSDEHEDYYSMERLNLLAHLISDGILDIRIAYTDKDNEIGMYHEKMGILEDKDGNRVAFSGSMNESMTAMSINYETIDVFCDWNEAEADRVKLKENAFYSMWNNVEPSLKVLEFPNISDVLIEKYRRKDPNFDIDHEQFKRRILAYGSMLQGMSDSSGAQVGARIPADVELHEYQKEAIAAWVGENYRGIFDMATGTGKTYLAMKYAEEKEVKPLVIVPNDFIKSQWKKSPLPCEVITYAGTKGLKAEEIAKKYPMVFCDEAQHIGAPVWGVFTDRLLELAESGACHVIGLTADPVRYTDGGRNVSDRFGKNVFSSYPLEKAIKEGVLPRFRYIGCSFTDSRNPDEKTLTLRKRLDIRANTPVIRNILKKDMPEGNRKAVFFISSKKDIPDTVRLAKTCGFRTVSVCASNRSKDVNRKAVQQFEQGSHTALVAIDMFDEGMHIKGTDTVVLLKRTTSPRVFYQEIGRALESGTKKEIAVFDLVSNLENMKVIDTHSAAECGEKRAEAKSGEQMIADAFSLDCSLVCQKTEAMVRREDRRDMREARRRTVGTGKEKTAAQKRAIREARRRIKKGRTVWSKEELETLRTYYPLEGRACAKRFPGRKPATIAAMAHSRGYICEKNQNRWKKEEEDILLQYWKTDPERVMRETGRTRHACENKAMHCGLNHKDEEIQPCVRSARTPWTYKELDILREYYHMETAAKVAQRIPGRSIHSIRSKAESMGLVPNHKWTREELGILKTYGLDDMDRLVMMLPAHKKYSIQRKAEQLGIA